MKKIYITFLGLVLFGSAKAQTLTAAANEPVSGDVFTYKLYDSLAVVPKTAGAGQLWNFTGFVQSTVAATVKSYSLPVAIPQASLFPGCNLVEVDPAADNIYVKSTATPVAQYEFLGLGNPGAGISLSFVNSLITAIWPVSLGYNNTDMASGTAVFNPTLTGTFTGTNNVQASGTGTVVFPNGVHWPNVLQMRITQTLNIALPTSTINIIGTDYIYFNSSQKFEVLGVSYEKETTTPSVGSPTVINRAKIKVNNSVLTGLNEKNFTAEFQIFPNPAKDAFNVNLTNTNNDKGSIEIFNALGQLVKTIDLGSDSQIRTNISLEGLNSGAYSVKTRVGTRTSTRKLIIE